MRRFLLLLFLGSVIFFFFLHRPSQAVCTGTCGQTGPDCIQQQRQCCNVADSITNNINVPPLIQTENIEDIEIKENTEADLFNPPGSKWGCIDLFFFQLGCISDMFNSGVDSVKSIFVTENAKDLSRGCEGEAIDVDVDVNDPKGADGDPVPTGTPNSVCYCQVPSDKKFIESRLCDNYLKYIFTTGNPNDQNNPNRVPRERLENQSREYRDCVVCMAGGKGYWSAIGCIDISNMQSFFGKTVFGIGVGLAGLFALLCIIYSAFSIQTSQGNPERLKKAQQNLTSCIMGLLLIIFSVFILRLIGVTLLRIPGLG